MTDLEQLSRDLVAWIAPSLACFVTMDGQPADEAGRKLGEAAWAHARKLWARLGPRIEANPFAIRAAFRAADAPQREGARIALCRELERILAGDPGLAAEVMVLWEQIQSSGAAWLPSALDDLERDSDLTDTKVIAVRRRVPGGTPGPNPPQATV